GMARHLFWVFWGEHLAVVLNHGNMGKAELSLFAGDLLELVFHLRQIRLVGIQQLTNLNVRHRHIGPAPDGLLSIVEQQGLDLPPLVVTESKLLGQALHVAEPCCPYAHPVVHRPYHGSWPWALRARSAGSFLRGLGVTRRKLLGHSPADQNEHQGKGRTKARARDAVHRYLL